MATNVGAVGDNDDEAEKEEATVYGDIGERGDEVPIASEAADPIRERAACCANEGVKGVSIDDQDGSPEMMGGPRRR